MATEWRWLASFSASCLHAARAILVGKKLVDPQLAELLAPRAEALQEEIRAARLPEIRFWHRLHALSHQIEHDRELAQTALRKTLGTSSTQETTVVLIAGRISELETAMKKVVPQLVDEVTTRSRPLRELWEAYGAGLLASIGRHTDQRLVVDRAEIVLVYPVTGGGGEAHLLNNSVRIEAVLTNNIPQLPEAARLSWLIAQLNNDLPMFSEKVHGDRLPRIASLAMLPPALQAAQELELCPPDPKLTELALSSWFDESLPPGVLESLTAWWHTYQESRPSWATALQALDKMLA